jgi:multimeric flavodoxin WrbA
MKKKLLIVNGSPRHGSSTEILAAQFEQGFCAVIPDAEVVTVRLNDLDIIPCQSCAVDPRPLLCIYRDELYPYLQHLREADLVLLASPIYFDTVSAQMKLFIDRCNCFRPPKFEHGKAIFENQGILSSKGAYILVGGEREKYDAAERVIGGLFIWCGIRKVGRFTYSHGEDRLGSVARDGKQIEECREFGSSCARSLGE